MLRLVVHQVHGWMGVLTNLSENYRLKVIDFKQGGVAWRCPEKKKEKKKNGKKFIAQPIVNEKI